MDRGGLGSTQPHRVLPKDPSGGTFRPSAQGMGGGAAWGLALDRAVGIAEPTWVCTAAREWEQLAPALIPRPSPAIPGCSTQPLEYGSVSPEAICRQGRFCTVCWKGHCGPSFIWWTLMRPCGWCQGRADSLAPGPCAEGSGLSRCGVFGFFFCCYLMCVPSGLGILPGGAGSLEALLP